MNPRGVTLVEILAAVSIMVVVTALSLPAVQGRLAGARLEAAQGQIEAAAIATRAESVKRGVSLELFVRAGKVGEGMEILVGEVEAGGGTTGLEKEVGRENGASDAQARRRGTMWGGLPAGIKVTGKPVLVDEKEPSRRGEDVGRDVRVAMFCPDGTAISSGCFLNDGVEEFEVTVNGWVGGARFSKHVSAGDGSEEQPAGDAASSRNGASPKKDELP